MIANCEGALTITGPRPLGREALEFLHFCSDVSASSTFRPLVLCPLRERPTLSPLGERVARAGAFFSQRGTGEGVGSLRRVCLGELFFQ